MEIRKITIDDKNYPKLLKKIPDAPKAIFFIGNLPKNNENCFAVVGTRKYSDYGRQAASDISSDLTDAGLVIVSGLAPGIDTFVHQSAVKKRKRTIAVLGTGLDPNYIYPKENIGLAQKIVELSGCLISEYPPQTLGSKFSFPVRNRIISGLSQGVLVIESRQKGGSLITANYAFTQKRKIFALPGSIHSINSQGPHNLIKRGAKLIENANDIIKELNLNNLTSLNKKKINPAAAGENAEQNIILEALKQEPLYLDKIIEKTKLPPQTVASELIILEMKRAVKNLGANLFTIAK